MKKKGVLTDTAIIIPVYNEASVIRSVVNEALKHFKYVICINDGSKDDSVGEILKTDAYFVDHPINMGQGAALQTGIEFARTLPVDFFVTFDADGQHRITDVKNMISVLKKGDVVDIVLGSRFLGEAKGITGTKKTVLKMAIAFTNATTGLELTDTHNGLRAFNRKVAEEMQITMSDMTHASEILEIIAQKKYRYKEIPVVIEYSDYSRSKGQSIINAINIGFDTLLRKVSK